MSGSGLAWSWAQSANAFSGVAGILAAFTISAIILILSSPPSNKATANQPVRAPSWQYLFYAYLVSLFSFVGSALLFSFVSGDTQSSDMRAAFTGMFAGAIMSIAVVQLLLAMLWTGAQYATQLSLTGAKALFVTVVSLAGLLMVLNQVQFFAGGIDNTVTWTTNHGTFVLIAVLVVLVVPLALGMSEQLVKPLFRSLDFDAILKFAYHAHFVSLYVSAAVTTFLLAGVSILREFDATTLTSIYTPAVSIGVLVLIGVCFFLFALGLPYRLDQVPATTERKEGEAASVGANGQSNQSSSQGS